MRLWVFVLWAVWLSLSPSLMAQTAAPPPTAVSAAPAAGAPARPADDLLKGAVYQYRLQGEQPFADPVPSFKATSHAWLQARCRFTLPASSALDAATLKVVLPDFGIAAATLNARPVEIPAKGAFYHALVIPGTLFQPGPNELEVHLYAEWVNTLRPDLSGSLFLTPLTLRDLAFVGGPILGAAGEDTFTVTCEMNLPAGVTVARAGAPSTHPPAVSPPGTLHRLRVSRDRAGGEYVLTATNGQAALRVPLNVPPFATADRLTFVVAGDTQNAGSRWGKSAAAILSHKPQLLVRTGDFVTHGHSRWQWDDDFLLPARDLLTRVPLYVVPGNHEGKTPIMEQLFYTPGGDGTARNWSQKVGPALLIGIDGRGQFGADTREGKWLEGVLASAADSRFIFLFNHYPGLSSFKHGQMKDGKFVERTTQRVVEDILPLLARYRATAYVSGHTHLYERLEPDHGVTTVVSGGGGAYMHHKTWDAPNSKVFVMERHYCLFEIEGNTCTMRVLTPEGKQIDTRVWQARRPD